MRPEIRPLELDPLGDPAFSARFLSSGGTWVLCTAAGTGLTIAGSHALTRWAGDRVEDADGFFLYLRDLQSGSFWSVGRQPAGGPLGTATARWEPGVLSLLSEAEGIVARLEIAVAPHTAVEVRRLVLQNRSSRRRHLDVTTYGEVVLADRAAHDAHPAFSKLFVQTEWVPEHRALLARRRPRARGERHPWLVHAVVGPAAVEFETDRVRFVGRGASLAAPLALTTRSPLSATVGNVLDPIVSLRVTVELPPGGEESVAFLLGSGADRAAALGGVASLASARAVDAALEEAGREARTELERLEIEANEAEFLQALAGGILYGHPALRAAPEILCRARVRRDVPSRLGIAIERPLALLHAENLDGAALLPWFRAAERYWRALGLPIDCLALRAEPQPAALAGRGLREECVATLAGDEVDALDALARLVVRDSVPDVASLGRAAVAPELRRTDPEASRDSVRTDDFATHPRPVALGRSRRTPSPLQFENGYGGFAPEDGAYVIALGEEGGGVENSAANHDEAGATEGEAQGRARLPPQPWINVIANERFGFLVSETGAGYTWSANSREHRLTPWSNDPLVDPHGEAFYVRDEETGEFWSALPGPAPARAAYEMRHALGESVCRHSSHDLDHETALFVPRRDPVKVVRLRLENRGGRPRRLSIYGYWRLVLGGIPEDAGRFVVTSIADDGVTVFARSTMGDDFADRVVFAAVLTTPQSRALRCTTDRESFLGRHGSLAEPSALRSGALLDGGSGAGLDPCVAQQAVLDLPAGGTATVCFLLGEGASEAEARALIERYRAPDTIAAAEADMREFWRDGVAGVHIETPAPALDLMVNVWLPYQTLGCRIWARSALYQSGGAFGFRDQLQDAAALVYLWPERTRAQLLLHAAHQFVEGDVLHWWHPPQSRGLRTRFVDDLLWLPYLTAFYVRTTGDWAVLDERVRLLSARPLAPGEDEAYLLPEESGETADLYAHCCRAIDRSLQVGSHGLPLFGSGDWNDGMNRVGRQGRGESVWMGFFLYAILADFAPLCARRQDTARVHRYREHRARLADALDSAGWDGAWYRRGYYDDGRPLGSAESDECRIDALVQAWAVLSGAAPPERAAAAMDAVLRHLVSESEGLIRLLAPPFDRTPDDPGYIKGYVPGVRENGGQYTHAALWVVRALAGLGRNDRVARLLEMLGGVHHARDAEAVSTYRVEPYVVAADIYGAPPHTGRGGWTWYTGSSGWMYRVALESLLGFQILDGEALLLSPCVPDDWPGFTLRYRVPGGATRDERGATRYEIVARNPARRGRGVRSATLDGAAQEVDAGVARIPLRRDGRTHRVEIVLGGIEQEDAS